MDREEQDCKNLTLNGSPEVLRETGFSSPLESTKHGICETPVPPLFLFLQTEKVLSEVC